MAAKEKGMDVFAANSYVVVTWLPPLDLDPFLSFPDDMASKDCVLFPAWKPGHWMLCVMKPKNKAIYFFDSNHPYGIGDLRYVNVFSKLTSRIAPGSWRLIKSRNVPTQLAGSNDCGIFMLMYALYMVFEAPFDFTASDFLLIRKWWCLLLLENFGIERQQAAIDMQSQHDICNRERLIVKDLLSAVGWLRENCNIFRGPVEEPSYMTLNVVDQEEALLQLDQAESDDRQLALEPFMFRFQSQEDMEVFFVECRDKRGLRVNSMFDCEVNENSMEF